MPKHTLAEKAKNTKSKKQVGLLLSKNSPITPTQKMKLRRELTSGKVCALHGLRQVVRYLL